jgi:lipopolysaccharide/colanic/teichoic acid biosynthesis glycosyltransferase
MANASDRKSEFAADPFTAASRARKYVNANNNVFGAGSSIPRRDLGYRIQLAAKRVIDVATSATAILVLLPAFAILAIIIRLDSPGPVFFRQVRWGQGGKKIRVFKFRSMRTDLGEGRPAYHPHRRHAPPHQS